MAVEPTYKPERGNAPRSWLLTGAIIAGILWAASEILVPLALAILMSFVLAPLVRRLQRWRVRKGLSVAIVVVFAFALVFGMGAFMATQVTQLAGNLPLYQTTITRKVQEAHQLVLGAGSFSRMAQFMRRLNTEFSGGQGKDQPNGGQQAQPGQGGQGAPEVEASRAPPPPPESRPIPVEVHQPEQSGVQTLAAVVTPLLHPLATTFLVVVFVIFILLQRQDLRNRFIRLAGSSDLHRTTAAMDDAARRLSRLYLVQLGINAGFGVVVGCGLAIIGVPSPFLWGTLAAIMRFIPYVGSLLSAVPPILLAIAVDPGWSMVVWTVLLFITTEPILGHLIEPMVQGHSTGLSPVAIVIAAAFWTWLWGPIGLVLSTPLTVCLVVLGRHIDAMQGFDVMFGDRPPLSPGETFYQRMLAGDPLEAADQAETYLAEHEAEDYCDTVALAGLRLAQADLVRGALPPKRSDEVRDAVDDLVDHLRNDTGGPWYERLGKSDDVEEAEAQSAADRIAPAWREEGAVLCIGGRTPLDEAAAALLAGALTMEGIGARRVGPETLGSTRLFQLSPQGIAMVCLCYLDQRSEGSVRYAVKRLQRKLPQAEIVIGLWGDLAGDELDRVRRVLDRVEVTTSIGQTMVLVRHAAARPAEAAGANAPDEVLAHSAPNAA